MNRTTGWILAAAAGLLCVAGPSAVTADVRLPNVIASNMVLQRGMPVPIWGWADANEQVTVTFGSQSKTATAGADGAWRVTLDKLTAGAAPARMVLKGKNTVTLENILVGEVWVGSGQSNMAWSVRASHNAKEEIAAAKYPKIRLFLVPPKQAPTPQTDLNARWVECSPKSVPSFSAALYYFGRTLHKELDVPMGLIATSWGGTPIEPWIPLAGLESVSSLSSLASKARAQTGTGGRGGHRRPTVLYNAMVDPLVPFAIRGAVWYQGESNAFSNDGMKYFEKKKGLIGGWRKMWAQTAGAPDGSGNFSFYFVQLAPWSRYKPTHLPALWEAQRACLTIPNTGMVVTTDITGNLNDIHPRDKQNVGKRLALWALAKDYGKKDLVYSGPLYKSMAVEGSTIRLSFDHVGSGLVSRDGKPLSWFTIARSNKKFVEATAKIDGNTVVVSIPEISKPKAVRFAWDRRALPNLSNKEGLPASPFRTDTW